ncbi:MAG: DUF2167 domain-containing protein [Candidatus Kapaibacterium sp.]
MKLATLTILSVLCITAFVNAQVIDSVQMKIDAIEQSLQYQTGIIELETGNATIAVPDGFRFLDKKQSVFVVSELWENPVDSSILGMLVPSNRGVLGAEGWGFIITFNEIGYVKDDDAADIDYDDLMKEMKASAEEANPERVRLGFESVKLIGWASTPFYDKQSSTLHWAKEIQFGDASTNTLNYNLRILGRKGTYNLNAVASMNQLSEVKSKLTNVLHCITYKEGHRYVDFSENADKVAAWTIGGLVAGKVLAKVGFFALILKFWKVLLVGIMSVGAGIRKYLSRKKNNDQTPPLNSAPEELPADAPTT